MIPGRPPSRSPSRRSQNGPIDLGLVDWIRESAVVRRLRSGDSERQAAAVVAIGIILAIGFLLLGGFVPFSNDLTVALYVLARGLPLFGFVLAVGTLWVAWSPGRRRVSSLLDGESPETVDTRTEERVGRETERSLAAAAGDRYRCLVNEPAADVRSRLTTAAVRSVETRRGATTEAARDAVREGTWTDDPVAAAFLATDRSQPFDERLRGAIDPGGAYLRRVRRTLAAIEAIETDETAANRDEETERTAESEVAP